MADRPKLILVSEKYSGIVIRPIPRDIPHITVHDPIVIRIIAVSLGDDLLTYTVVPMLMI